MRAFIVERLDWDGRVVAAAEHGEQAVAVRAAEAEWRTGRQGTRTVRVLDAAGSVVWLVTVAATPKSDGRRP